MDKITARGFIVTSVGFNGKTFDGNPLRSKNVNGAPKVLGSLIVGDELTIHQNEGANYASWKVVLPDGSFTIADPGDLISLDEDNKIIEVIKLK